MSGAIRLYDEPPRGAEPVCALFGPCELVDWSTSSDRGHEQNLTIVVWAASGCAASGLSAADRLSVLAARRTDLVRAPRLGRRHRTRPDHADHAGASRRREPGAGPADRRQGGRRER